MFKAYVLMVLDAIASQVFILSNQAFSKMIQCNLLNTIAIVQLTQSHFNSNLDQNNKINHVFLLFPSLKAHKGIIDDSASKVVISQLSWYYYGKTRCRSCLLLVSYTGFFAKQSMKMTGLNRVYILHARLCDCDLNLSHCIHQIQR